jgi:antagonist of KipI
MNNIRIIKAGVLDTIQDMGRYGWQQLGINPGGAMDRWSVRAANILVANNRQEAVMEMHFPASDFFFEKPVLLAICGADFSPYINGEEVPCNQPILVNRYSILQFRGIKKGARAYLALHGGFDVPRWLQSYSTHLKAGAGGYKGKALQKEDEIIIPSLPQQYIDILGKKEFIILPWKADIVREEENKNDILVLPGNEWDRLDDHSKEVLLHHPFTISHYSDRMGYRLQGDQLITTSNDEVVSSAVSFGTIQLLPDGQLIILMADHQTTGGYPRVAHIVSAHHSRLAQRRVGEKLFFSLTNQQKAEDLLLKDQQHLLQLQNACTFRLQQYIDAHRL